MHELSSFEAASSIVDVSKNINENINCTKIKASRAQGSTKLVPQKIKGT
jgi:hypothetical protein